MAANGQVDVAADVATFEDLNQEIAAKADASAVSNVDNTADTAKPVSTAQQTALDLKANIASPTFTGTVGGITKAMVGLGNLDNTSDASKPVSTAQQTALDGKSALVHTHIVEDITSLSPLLGDYGAAAGTLLYSEDYEFKTGAVVDSESGASLAGITAEGWHIHAHEGELVVPAGDIVWPGRVTAIDADDRALSRIINGRAIGYLGLTAEVADTVAVFIYGQSNPAGSNGGIYENIFDDAPHPAAVMFPFGTEGLGNVQFSTLDSRRLVSLRAGTGPASTGQNQTMAEALAMQIIAEVAERGEGIPEVAVMNAAFGGASTGILAHQLDPVAAGRFAFDNLERMAERLSALRPGSHMRPVLVVDQGETSIDVGQTKADYKTGWEGILDDFDTYVVQAQMGLPAGAFQVLVTPTPIIVLGITNGGGGQDQQDAWAEIATARSNVAVATSRYDLGYTDALHIGGDEQQVWGARNGHLAAQWYLDGTVTPAATLASASIDGSDIVVVATEVMVDLDPDYTETTLGFAVERAGVDQTIDVAQISPDGTVILTMNTAPALGDVVRYARVADRTGTGPGVRGTVGVMRSRRAQAFDVSSNITYPITASDIAVT